MKREIVITSDGSPTFFVPELNEHFHSVNGAIQESAHVFLKYGFVEKLHQHTIRVFEMGWGTGLNSFLTFRLALQLNKSVYYQAVEAFPLNEEEYSLLDFGFKDDEERKVFRSMHEMNNGEIQIFSSLFTFEKQLKTLENFMPAEKAFDVVFFDAFAPDIQPELWSEEVFKKMFYLLNPGGILVTYSAKGQVRRNMKAAGFQVEKLPGPLGKREMTRALKA